MKKGLDEDQFIMINAIITLQFLGCFLMSRLEYHVYFVIFYSFYLKSGRKYSPRLFFGMNLINKEVISWKEKKTFH
jgi:hypothetical protein